MKLFLVLAGMLLTGCMRLQAGAFYAKKDNGSGPAQVKQVHVDTNELLPARQQDTPGKIEV